LHKKVDPFGETVKKKDSFKKIVDAGQAGNDYHFYLNTLQLG
jgi:hypothetical protein